MKKDLLTAISIAILGAAVAFAICNIFLGPIESVRYKTIQSTIPAGLTEPDENIFNFNALNPTVEVFVGRCDRLNEMNECIDDEAESQPEQENDDGPSY